MAHDSHVAQDASANLQSLEAPAPPLAASHARKRNALGTATLPLWRESCVSALPALRPLLFIHLRGHHMRPQIRSAGAVTYVLRYEPAAARLNCAYCHSPPPGEALREPGQWRLTMAGTPYGTPWARHIESPFSASWAYPAKGTVKHGELFTGARRRFQERGWRARRAECVRRPSSEYTLETVACHRSSRAKGVSRAGSRISSPSRSTGGTGTAAQNSARKAGERR